MYAILISNRFFARNSRTILKNKYNVQSVQWKIYDQGVRWPHMEQCASFNTDRVTLSNKTNTSHGHTHHPVPVRTFLYRNFSQTQILFDKEPLKPSSKVEATVETMKKELEEKDKAPKKVVKKKSLKERAYDEMMHYYHGFRLLGTEVNISTKYAIRILRGEALTRREHRLLVRTIGDLFRLVPFLVIILVPFLEFALPVIVKVFPGMLPSTFETSIQKDEKNRQHLKVKLEMAKFFQETLDEMAPQGKHRHSELAKEFQEFFNRVRTTGEVADNDEIMKFSKLFEDEITLDSLQRPHLVALCRVLNVSTLGTSAMLRFNLRMKLRSLAADDKMIAKEGVHSLNLSELQQACRARGMRAYGISEERLRNELHNWLDLSLNVKVPPSLLLLSRALMVPDHVPTTYKLKATISALPEHIVTQTKAAIGEKEGIVDYQARVEALKLEVKKIEEENKERKEAEEETQKLEDLKRSKEVLKDMAPILDAGATPNMFDPAPIVTDESIVKPKKEEVLSTKDIEVIEDAIENIAQTKKSLLLEKEGIQELKEEMSDYREDVRELLEINKVNKGNIKVTKGASRLYRAVKSMINKMDRVLDDLESKEKALKSELEQQTAEPQTRQQLVHIDELMDTIKRLQKVPDEAKLNMIQDILGRLDDDFDGQLKVEDVLKMVEIIGNEHVQLSEKQMGELIELLDKEEILEVESKIQKALDKAAEADLAKQQDSRQKSLFDLIKEAQEKKKMAEQALAPRDTADSPVTTPTDVPQKSDTEKRP